LAAGDDLAEAEGNAVERVIAGPGLCLLESLELAPEGSLGPSGGVVAAVEPVDRGSWRMDRRLQSLDEPTGHGWDLAAPRDHGVAPAAPVAAGWRDDVATVTADVEAVAEAPAGIVGDLVPGMTEVEVCALPSGGDRPTRRERPVRGDKATKTGVTTVPGIDVEHDQATLDAGADADVRVGPPVPPHLDLAGVCGRGVEPTADARMLGW
jgi:hypothetical protein